MRGSRVDPGDWAQEREARLGFLVIRAKRWARVVALEKVRRKPPPSGPDFPPAYLSDYSTGGSLGMAAPLSN